MRESGVDGCEAFCGVALLPSIHHKANFITNPEAFADADAASEAVWKDLMFRPARKTMSSMESIGRR